MKDIQTCITKDHYDILAYLAAECHSYIEIGVREGGSLLAALKPYTLDSLILCDTWDMESGGTGRGSDLHIQRLLRDMDYQGECLILSEPSQGVNWKALVGGFFSQNVDLVNIDGSHEYEDAFADISNLWPCTGKYMVIHDVSIPDVWRAIQDCLQKDHLKGSLGIVSLVGAGTFILERIQ